MAAKPGERFMLWGRENAEFLEVAFAGVAGIVVTSGKTCFTVTKLQEALCHKREMREKDIRHEQEMRQVAVKEAVICSQVDLAERLEDLTFSKEYKKWRKELYAKIAKK